MNIVLVMKKNEEEFEKKTFTNVYSYLVCENSIYIYYFPNNIHPSEIYIFDFPFDSIRKTK